MTWLVYGAYGYTGELITKEAVSRDLDPIVAGRNSVKSQHLGDTLGCEHRSFSLTETVDHLDDVDLVLNCAGPFVDTYESLVSACLETETHYLDITGELEVFEALAERDREAEQAGICLLPGVGFDVVPTDCLAGHLHDRLPEATQLRLGFDASGTFSGGTLASMVEHAGKGGRIRRNGEIQRVPAAHETREIDFGRGPRTAVTIPWGDVSTAYYTTGIENIEVYTSLPRLAANGLRFGRVALQVFEVEPVKRTLQSVIRSTVSGPSAEDREQGSCYVWGEASDGDSQVTSRLQTPETYALTVDAATTAVERVLSGDFVGFETPAAAFTPEFVLDLDGIEGFHDEPHG